MAWKKWADVSSQRLSTVLRQTLVLGILLMLLGILAYQAVPRSPEIAPETLLSQLDNQEAPLILDVRSEAEYNKGHIPGAIHISHRDLPDRLEELAAFKAQPVILYCEAGVRAGIAETTLVDAGFQQVIHLAGDMQEWRRREFPVESRSAIP
ncbi:MAG: rhodanese-like domain-containing protein [Leptolyngbyaceae cyanobacterium]